MVRPPRDPVGHRGGGGGGGGGGEEAAVEAAEEAAVCVWMGGGVADVTHQKNVQKKQSPAELISSMKNKTSTRVRVPVTRTKRDDEAALCDMCTTF